MIEINLSLRIPCIHTWRIRQLYFHRGRPWALCICSQYQTRSPFSGCTTGSIVSHTPVSSTWRSTLHRTISHECSSHKVLLKFLVSCSRARRCSDSFSGASCRLAREPQVCVCPRMVRSQCRAFSIAALAMLVRLYPNLLASSCVIWLCFWLWAFYILTFIIIS